MSLIRGRYLSDESFYENSKHFNSNTLIELEVVVTNLGTDLRPSSAWSPTSSFHLRTNCKIYQGCFVTCILPICLTRTPRFLHLQEKHKIRVLSLRFQFYNFLYNLPHTSRNSFPQLVYDTS